MTITDHSPTSLEIAWSGVHIGYQGQSYTVADGHTDNTYVYWLSSSPTTFQVSNTYPTLTDADILVFVNKNGVHLTVPNTTIIDGSLLVPESVVADALAANSVTSDKIMAGAVTANALAAGAVTANSILAGAVTASAIAANAVVSNAIVANAITTDKLATNAVTAAKIAAQTITGDRIAGGTITGSNIASDTITANNLNVTNLAAITANLGQVVAGGSGNGNGSITVKDSSNNTAVTIDNNGIVVNEGSFYLQPINSSFKEDLEFKENLFNDHSFELLAITGSADSDHTFAWNPNSPPSGNSFWWTFSNSSYARVLSYASTDTSSNVVPFGVQAACVGNGEYQGSNLYQTIPVSYGQQVVISCYTSILASAVSWQPRLEVAIAELDANENALTGYYVLQDPYPVTVIPDWSRHFVSYTPSNVNCRMIEVRFGAYTITGSGQDLNTGSVPLLAIDGAQAVLGAVPTLYNPETSLWAFINGNYIPYVQKNQYAWEGYEVLSDRLLGYTNNDQISLGTNQSLLDVTGGMVRIKANSTVNNYLAVTSSSVGWLINGSTTLFIDSAGNLSTPETITDQLAGKSNTNVVKLGTSGVDFDMTGGTIRFRRDSSNYYSFSSSNFAIYFSGAAKHIFNSNGTKTGGSIELSDGKTWGMSPLDSPQSLIEYVLFDQELPAGSSTISIDTKFAEAVNNQYDVWPSVGSVILEAKTSTDFTVSVTQPTTASFRLIGKRKDAVDQNWVDMDAFSEGDLDNGSRSGTSDQVSDGTDSTTSTANSSTPSAGGAATNG